VHRSKNGSVRDLPSNESGDSDRRMRAKNSNCEETGDYKCKSHPSDKANKLSQDPQYSNSGRHPRKDTRGTLQPNESQAHMRMAQRRVVLAPHRPCWEIGARSEGCIM